jgi:phytoene synthase
MKKIFDDVSIECSKITTRSYSTSFSLGIKFLNKRFQNPIYSIYGFVRFADEIVDTFHEFNKAELLNDFKKETYKAIANKISLNPILNSFQKVVNEYSINIELIDAFLESMEMDLNKTIYDQKGYEKYILGSAEVVGLMCLKVFTENNTTLYKELEYNAMKLGSAFQKINFLRDLKDDNKELGRMYFPNTDMENLTNEKKKEIEKDIQIDFNLGYEGIKKLPKDARFGVYVAYVYYLRLFKKIKSLPAQRIMEERIRIPNNKKYALFFSSYLKHSLNLL